MKVRTRSHGRLRAKFYGCAGYHDRGRTVCTNHADIPMADADAIVLEALLDDVVTPDIIDETVDGAVALLRTEGSDSRREELDAQLGKIDRERERLVAAIATGGALDGLVEALREREQRRAALLSEREAIVAQRPARALDILRLRAELEALAREWRHVLADDAPHARPIVSQLLVGRVSLRPLETAGRWELRGEGTLAGLFTREIFPSVWRPKACRVGTRSCRSFNRWPNCAKARDRRLRCSSLTLEAR